jgi:hypothetical protein
MRIRATVYLRDSAQKGPDSSFSEWSHEDEQIRDEGGIVIRWSGSEKTFIPYSNIARIDMEPCDCWECEKDTNEQARASVARLKERT